jgi:hypothetical protein
VILLDQSETYEKFTLGSATRNNFVLKHPNSADENICYINIVHSQLYPDPDSSSIVLFNSSTSLFYAHSLTGPYVKHTIAKDQEATLECGRWKVILGRGLDFEVDILPWTPSEIQGDLEIISPVPVVHSPPKEYQIEPPAKGTFECAGTPSPKRNITTSGPAGHTAAKAARFSLPIASTSIVDPLDIQIGETARTTVIKRVCNGMVSAIKICRQPTTSGSADVWRNEMEILNRLNHVSIITEH